MGLSHPFFFWGGVLWLDLLFILGEPPHPPWHWGHGRGGPFMVPPPKGVFGGDRDCLEGGPPHFWGGSPKSCTGDDGFGSWHGGGTRRGGQGQW